MTGRIWIFLGALSAAGAVTAGAVGTHYLKEVLHAAENDLQTYELAVRYQMYHAVALVLVGLVEGRARSSCFTAAAVAFLLGSLLFCGGVYGWLFSDMKSLIHVVPVGGLTWILGWLLLAVGALVCREVKPGIDGSPPPA